jgi:hypothetical protein
MIRCQRRCGGAGTNVNNFNQKWHLLRKAAVELGKLDHHGKVQMWYKLSSKMPLSKLQVGIKQVLLLFTPRFKTSFPYTYQGSVL